MRPSSKEFSFKYLQSFPSFGMVMQERSYSGPVYRFGFNGKEKENEINVDAGDYDFGARIYDSRLGRFLSTDPKSTNYPHYCPYLFAGNNPIWKIDFEGKDEVIVTTKNTTTQSYHQTKVVGNTQEASSYRGIDVVTQTIVQTITFKDVNSKILYTVTQVTSISVTIDENGAIASPIVSRQSTLISYPSGGAAAIPTESEKSVPLNQTSINFQAKVNAVSKFKIEHNGLSPIQQEAEDNKSFNDKVQIFGDGEALIGAGTTIAVATGCVPEPTSKIATVGGLALSGVGVATQFISKEEDPNKIEHSETSKTSTTQSSDGYVISPPAINK